MTTYAERFDAAVMPSYGTPSVTLVRGAGAEVWDAEDRRYLDLLGGIAVSSLGHAHPAVVAAVTDQVGRIAHTSNLAINLPSVRLAERLRDIVGDPTARTFFANSGAEANEAALKLIWRARPGRRHIVAAQGSFHGRTLGALSITGQPAKRAAWEPLLGPVTFVPYGDADALAAAVTDETAGVFLEAVQGEAGVLPAPPGYLEVAREACDAHDALLVFDEVQGGVGRTGAMLSYEVVAPGVRPDVLTLAKGLGGGLPIGACVAVGATAQTFKPGDHGSTFGGNPVSCAAALAVFDTIESERLLAAATERGAQLRDGVLGLGSPLVTGVRGHGLWLAVVLAEPVAKHVETALRESGALANAVAPDALRLAPPLVVSAAHIDEVPGLLGPALAAATLPATDADPAAAARPAGATR